MCFQLRLVNKHLVLHFATGRHRIEWLGQMLEDSVQTNDEANWNAGGPSMDFLLDNNCDTIQWSPYNYDIKEKVEEANIRFFGLKRRNISD